MLKYVLTGGHGTGKTSILLELERRGEWVVREAASDHQRLQRAKGLSFPTDRDDFEQEVLDLHLRRENSIPPGTPRVFLDRGLPDHLVYGSLFRYPLSRSHMESAGRTDYAAVFLVEPFGPEWTDLLNPGEQAESLRVETGVLDLYERLGYRVRRIGPGALEHRVELILHDIR